MQHFFEEAKYQNSQIRTFIDFLKNEESNEQSKQYSKLRFVGYVLDISFEEVTIITSDPFKIAVGGVPRGSFLIMAPIVNENLPPHFSLLRVVSSAPTPLSTDVQQTYFELHKKSMPELDRWTTSELQWGALKTKVLGMYYPDPKNSENVVFSGDVNNIVSGHKYKIFSPTDKLLDLIVNGALVNKKPFAIGKLRPTECELPFANSPSNHSDLEVNVSTQDFKGFRTAMFGKTRLGKSNVVKLIAQSLIETTSEENSVGQLIFDINGEYANDNPQDGNKSIRSAYENRCIVYALTRRSSTPSKPLKLNFFEQPDSCMAVIRDFLNKSSLGTSGYIRSFVNSNVPSIEETLALPQSERIRNIRKIQIYWAILNKAGFNGNDTALSELELIANRNTRNFNPGFTANLRNAAYPDNETPPANINGLGQLQRELELVEEFRKANPRSALFTSTGSGNPIFDADDLAMLQFLMPTGGGSRSGPSLLRDLRDFHNDRAGDFITDILTKLDEGITVILDLGNAADGIRRYFADMLSRAVFSHQEKKFVEDKLDNHFIQLYFEEAHNIFPKDDKNVTDVYSRFAKEGAKFHIGLVYSTQSPTTVNKDLLQQTENFFVAHLSSKDEVSALAKLQVAFEGIENDILRTRTPGYIRMLTFSHRFVIPTQAIKFSV